MREPKPYHLLKDTVINSPTTADPNQPEVRSKEPESARETDNPEERFEARKAELEDKFKRGLINRHELDYKLKRFDQELAADIQPQDGRQSEASPNREAVDRDPAPNSERDDANKEMTDVRAARRERLRNIGRQIEREFSENADNMLERDAGNRSR